jgi:hypothetical protein
MGHIRLGTLPKTRKWRQVVDLLRRGADLEAVAGSAAEAAETSLRNASADPAFLHAFWLLTQIPLAPRGPAFADDLRRLGLEVPDEPSLMDVTGAFMGAVDQQARECGGRTDLGEMAQMAAVESLTAAVAPMLPSLFGAEPEDVQRAVGRHANGDRFAALARGFFARLTQRSLDYYLSRELSNHVGAGERFHDDGARSRFDDALERHCREASRIVETFAGGWYGKNVYQRGGLTPAAVGRFAPIAFRKMRAELRKRRDAKA